MGSDQKDEVFDSVQKWQSPNNWASILSYTIQSMASEVEVEPDRDFAKQIACQNRGVWTDVVFPEEPDVSSYLSLIALPYEFQATSSDFVAFSPVYVDSSFLGDVVTISKGYHRSCENSGLGPERVFLGVVGIDIKVIDLSKLRSEYAEFQQNQVLGGVSIRYVTNLDCQLQVRMPVQYGGRAAICLYFFEIFHLFFVVISFFSLSAVDPCQELLAVLWKYKL